MARALDANPLWMVVDGAGPESLSAMDMAVDEGVFAVMPLCGVSASVEYLPYTASFMSYDQNLFGPIYGWWLDQHPEIKSIIPCLDKTGDMKGLYGM